MMVIDKKLEKVIRDQRDMVRWWAHTQFPEPDEEFKAEWARLTQENDELPQDQASVDTISASVSSGEGAVSTK